MENRKKEIKRLRKYKERQICICCKTNTFSPRENKKYCKFCRRYINSILYGRIKSIQMSMKRITGEIEDNIKERKSTRSSEVKKHG